MTINRLSTAAQPTVRRTAPKPAATTPEQSPAQPTDVRIVSYNTAVGASGIKTPQADFTKLPVYHRALTNAPGAAVMCLQEVGKDQIAAARRFEAQGTCKVLVQRVHALDQYNMIVVPARYKVEAYDGDHFMKAQTKTVGRELWNWVTKGQKPALVDMYQPRGFQEVRLKDTATNKTLTVFNTHMALDRDTRLDQAHKLVGEANEAAKRGGVVVAGDLNTDAATTNKRDAVVRRVFEGFQDMGPAEPTHSGGKNIDWVLTKGFESVSGKVHRGQSLQAPDGRDASVISDHFAEEDVLRFK
jgi:endonuclease/exonuclease/phosphatase family metal-dependent hydrolase